MKTVKTNKKRIYLDHAASTPLDPLVEGAMRPWWGATYANPSALYGSGVFARKAVEGARTRVAAVLNCMPKEIIFVPGGTASDNLAVLGAARAAAGRLLSYSREYDNGAGAFSGNRRSYGHIIVSPIEHEAVLEPARHLEKEGFDVTFLKVDKDGLVKAQDVKRALRPDTILVSVMYANNEIGTVQPIAEIAKAIRNFRKVHGSATLPLLHTDACQAANYLELNVQKLGVDLMTLNASKIYGPKMSGVLYVRRSIKLDSLVFGGGQERGLWSGTENVPGIIGFARALEIAEKLKEKESERLAALRDYLISRLQHEIKGVTLNGHAAQRLPNNVHVSVSGMEGEVLVLYLDREGIEAAVGSACTSQSIEPSHVLTAIGLFPKDARSSLRLTLGRSTTKADCDAVTEALKKIVELLK